MKLNVNRGASVMTRATTLGVVILATVCSLGLAQTQGGSTNSPPISVNPPVVVTAYVPLDCGASQLLIRDKSNHTLYLYNKPFRPELFLSTAGCSFTPDMTCSIQITNGCPLQAALISCLGQFAASQRDAAVLQKIGEEKNFTKLSKKEQLLYGTLSFLNNLKAIKETATNASESGVAPAPRVQR